MSYTNETTYYGLPLPVGSDKSTFTDNNTAFQAVDAALHTAVEQSGAAASDLVTVKGDIVDLKAADVSMQSDIDSNAANIEALQQKESLQDAEIAGVKADAFDMVTAYNEPTATSTHAYTSGDYFIYNDVLYKATRAIAIGDTIVPDTNCKTTNITTELKDRTLDVSVTADGVKTYSQLLNDLLALVDVNKLANNSVLDFGNYNFPITIRGGAVNFSGSVRTANDIRTIVVSLSNNASTYEYILINHSGEVSYFDNSSNVVTSGLVMGISY